MSGAFRGLTWDHPRGYNALAAASRVADPVVAWDKQPLEGFESAPIAALAVRYDLLVLDHPHIGEAVAEACLIPLEDIFSAAEISAWRDQTIGPAMTSYHWAGRHWALPLDVATQVMAYRADLLDKEPPKRWDDVAHLAERRPVALSLAGPHAILNLLSICVSLGHPPGAEHLFDEDAAAEALSLMRRIAGRAPVGSASLNPIRLLEEMATGDGIALVPLVYGYVNYARPSPGRSEVSFADAPAWKAGGRLGSVLGGTGIAVSQRAAPDRRLLDHLRWLMQPETQAGFIPGHDGQPSARSAWLSKDVDAAAGGFYSRTFRTVEDAFVRPRHDGYIAFQSEASAIVRQALFDETSISAALDALRLAWRQSRGRARGPLQ